MAAAGIHPSIADLQAFALGTLPDASLAEVEAHVADCPTCQERAANASGDHLVELLRRVHANTTRHPETISETAHAETPSPVATDARADTLTHTAADPRNDASSATVDAVRQELVQHERYRIVRLLGEGGMGSVYEAEHRVMQRAVALKVINSAFTSRPATVERFRREVRAAARLSHPNIVTTYDAEDAGSTLFLVMEYVEGASLGRLVKERGPLPIAEACNYVRQAALGLQHAHERGMVHRDVKPDNLIRTPEGQVKVLDFGLAALRGESGGDLTEENTVMGTPDYMAPEQAEDARSADIRADVYSLGCTLYYLLTGSVPYPAPTAMLKILAHREQPLPSIRQARPDVSPELARVVARLLAKKPEDRLQTPAEVAAALAPFADTNNQAAKRSSKRGWLFAAAVLFVGLFLAAGVVVYRIQTDRGELVITTESDDVEVIVKQGGKFVDIIDTKTKKHLTLRSGVYDLELKDGKGLKLDLTHATLTRGETVLAKIERLPKPAPPAVVEAKKPLMPAQPAAAEIQVLQRMPIPRRKGWSYTAVAPDGKLFAAALPDFGTMVLDGQTGKELYRLNVGLGEFTPDGSRFVTVNWESPHVHDAATGKKLLEIPGSEQGHGLLTLPDSRHFLLPTSNKLRLGDLQSGKFVKSWPWGEGASYSFTADGRILFLKLAGEKGILAWDVQQNKASDEFGHIVKGKPRPNNYDFLPGNKQAIVDEGDTRYLVDLADGKLVALLPPLSQYGSPVNSGGRPNCRAILNAYSDGKLRLIDRLTGKERAVWQFPNGENILPGHHISLSPDGRHACVRTDCAVYLFRLPELPAAQVKKEPEKVGEVFRKRWPGHVNSSVDLSPDGRLLAAGYWGVTRVWDVSTGEPIREHAGWIGRFTPDGKRLVVADKCLHVYDAENGKLIRQCTPGFTRGFWDVQVLSDGKRAVSASADRVSRLWDLETGELLHSWPLDQKPPPPAADMDPTYSISCRGSRKVDALAGGTVVAVDRASGKEIARMSAGNFQPSNLSISRDGRFVAACAANQECDLVVWRLPEPAGKAKP
jgi:serine/threonine protein kinase/WD40 repeat protein